MNVKLLLAESLDVLKKAEERESQTDQMQDRVARSGKKDFQPVKKMYASLYDAYIKGLEMLNFCRRTAIDSGDDELSTFCAEKMNSYMNRCEKLRDKESNILSTLEQAVMSGLNKEGFEVGQTVFHVAGSEPLKQSQPIIFENTLDDGSYQLVIKNLDDYSVAAPIVEVQFLVRGKNGKAQIHRKFVPPHCAWSRFVGVVGSGSVKLRVSTDAWVRSSHVDVTLRQLLPSANVVVGQVAGESTEGGWVAALPPLPPIPDMDDLQHCDDQDVEELPSAPAACSAQPNKEKKEELPEAPPLAADRPPQPKGPKVIDLPEAPPPASAGNGPQPKGPKVVDLPPREPCVNPAGETVDQRMSRMVAIMSGWKDTAATAPTNKDEQILIRQLYLLTLPTEIDFGDMSEAVAGAFNIGLEDLDEMQE